MTEPVYATTSNFRRIVCVLLAGWSLLSAVAQVADMLDGASMWRTALVMANIATAAILIRGFLLRRPLTWRFLLFPQFPQEPMKHD